MASQPGGKHQDYGPVSSDSKASARIEESAAEVHANEIKATFALMQSPALLPAFAIPLVLRVGKAVKNCFDCADLDTLLGACEP